MASINKVTDILAAIKAVYPYYAKDSSIELTAQVWHTLLKPYDEAVVQAAVFKCLQTCKNPPTPAEVIEQINAVMKMDEPSDEELWSIYNKALIDTADQMTRFGYTHVDRTGISQGKQARMKVDEIWEGLPDKIKGYLSNKGELMRCANSNNFDLTFATMEKQRFLRAMPAVAKRQEYKNLLLESGGGKNLLKGGE